MKWLSRDILTILFAISLTSFSASFLYVLLTKEFKHNKKSKKQLISMRIKIPKHIVPAIIGRRGAMIQTIQKKTNTNLHIIEADIDVPDRICIIESEDITNILSAKSAIEDIINNYSMADVQEVYIQQKIWNKIEVNNLSAINEIQKSSGARIILDNTLEIDKNQIDEGTKKLTIIGNANQITLSLKEIQNLIKNKDETRQSQNFTSTIGNIIPTHELMNISISQDGLINICVSAMETPDMFWIQIIDYTGYYMLNNLMENMTKYYDIEENRQRHTLKKIIKGQMVAVKFKQNKWYRGQIMEEDIENYCKIYFVDYGYMKFISTNNIFEIRTDMLSLRLQAMECSLANVKPLGSDDWSPKACEKFAEFIHLKKGRIFIAKIRGYKNKSPTYETFDSDHSEQLKIPCIDIYDHSMTQNIGELLIKCKLAEMAEKTSTFTKISDEEDYLFMGTPHKILIIKS